MRVAPVPLLRWLTYGVAALLTVAIVALLLAIGF
jgi:hypothetical protein